MAALPIFGQTFIDKFVDEDVIDSQNIATGVTRTSSLTGLANVLGGERQFSETRLATLAGHGNSTARLAHGATIDPEGNFGFVNGTHSRNEVVLEYGLSAGVKFDFSAFVAGGSFRLVDWSTDIPDVTLELTLRSNVGNLSLERSQSKSVVLPASAATNVDISFALFDTIDFANIDDLTLKFTSQSFATDATASALVVAIPEPQVYASLVGILTLGAMQLRRRRLA